jgi:hypothetical protein
MEWLGNSGFWTNAQQSTPAAQRHLETILPADRDHRNGAGSLVAGCSTSAVNWLRSGSLLRETAEEVCVPPSMTGIA